MFKDLFGHVKNIPIGSFLSEHTSWGMVGSSFRTVKIDGSGSDNETHEIYGT